MTIGENIYKLRTDAKLTQEQFSGLLGVSQQSVQKWESGSSNPDLDKLIKISKYFDVSLDALILGNDNRIVEEMKHSQRLKPQYQNFHDWEFYSSNLHTEYLQSMEEGLDIEAYKDVLFAVSKLPKGEIKKKFGDVIFEVISTADCKKDYGYREPSELVAIRALSKAKDAVYQKAEVSENQISGAWLGRICGCMLGKTVEGIRTDELVPFLKETDNYPMHRYIYRSDINDEIINKYKFGFAHRPYADEIDGMPVDDDTNYVVLAQKVIDKYGKDFTPYDISRAWLSYQSKNAYCTAERVAFCNFIKGYAPPESASYKNPFREWIGAQIRGDYFGYINPGDPATAAEMAWRDASVSHIKNGIYGEMLISAIIAVAATTTDIELMIRAGLDHIPFTSRLYEDCIFVLNAYKNGMSKEKCFKYIHEKYDEYTSHGWCHTNPNAMIVIASLLYGNGDFGKSICMAVETGFDTDCNGATVGSILGMAFGESSIPKYWTDPIKDTLHTSIFGIGTVKISDRVKLTMEHIADK